jgi:integrase
MGEATREQIIPRNPANREYMDAPKTDKKEPSHLNDEQAQRFVSLLLNEPDKRKKTAFILLIYSGVRVGELAGLEWPDIDFDNRTITVKRTSQFCTGYGVITKAPKNATSARTIKLPATAFAVIREYRKWYIEQRFAIGSKWADTNRLFVQWDGEPITPTTFNKWLANFIKENGLPHITPHGLRHTNLSSFRYAKTAHFVRAGLLPGTYGMEARPRTRKIPGRAGGAAFRAAKRAEQ